MWALRDQAQDFKFAVAEFGRGERRATGCLLQRNFLGRTGMAAKVPVVTMSRW
jgi:hypothetical protein